MSFLKITDPSKRDLLVNEYLRLKRSIQQNAIEEKLGDIGMQRELTKLYKPITESQAGLSSQLTAIKEATSGTTAALQALPTALKAISFPAYPSIEAYQEPEETSHTIELGDLATKYLQQYAANKKYVDTTFGIYSKDGQFYVGTMPITIQGDDVTVGNETYSGTPGLWELLTMQYPNKTIYTQLDIENYAKILDVTNAIRNPSNPNKPKSSRSEKYREIIKPIWENLPYIGPTAQISPTPRMSKTGNGIPPVILPRDPNALIERLPLLLAGFKAGNTGAANEAVAITDELLRQGILNSDQYKAMQLMLTK